MPEVCRNRATSDASLLSTERPFSPLAAAAPFSRAASGRPVRWSGPAGSRRVVVAAWGRVSLAAAACAVALPSALVTIGRVQRRRHRPRADHRQEHDHQQQIRGQSPAVRHEFSKKESIFLLDRLFD
jgi:hypothetical protein